MKAFFANLFILAGICLLFFSSLHLWQRNNPNRLAFSSVSMPDNVSSEQTAVLLPTSLSISALDIHLPVVPAAHKEGHWETTTKGVSFLTSSANPGEIGNSIFYGHNYKNILGNLKKAKPGDNIAVNKSDGSIQNYRVEYVQVVSPDTVGILDSAGDRRLTLYTCTGFLDSKRLVVTAFPK